MAQLDRLLASLVTQRAEALELSGDAAAQLTTGGARRPLTRQPLTSQQVLMLLREVAPVEAAREIDAGRPVTFRYTSGDGSFVARLMMADGGWSARLEPDEPSVGDVPGVSDSAPDAAGARGATAEHRMRGVAVSGMSVAAPVDPAALDAMERLLCELVRRGGSDLHLRCGEPPIIRKDGSLLRLDGGPLADEGMSAMLHAIMPERNRAEFAECADTDFAYEITGVARFRCNALRERKGTAAVCRVIPAEVITADQLGLSPAVQQLCQLHKGLVLVTGPTGSGKSTTLCALLDLVNRTRQDHVITIEDPIEFVHENKQCLITQRQVGVHTGSFKSALRAALREDPDIVLVGELRDLETVSIAIETAETGHLVFGTLHTTTAPSTVDRLIDQFPADRQEQIRVMLSESLKGVISQTLCKRIGGGRVAAQEVLLSIPAVSNLIREGKTFQIPSIMQTSRRVGMVTLTDALLELVDTDTVEAAEAYAKAADKPALLNALRSRGRDTSFAEEAGSAAASSGAGGAGTSARPGVRGR